LFLWGVSKRGGESGRKRRRKLKTCSDVFCETRKMRRDVVRDVVLITCPLAPGVLGEEEGGASAIAVAFHRYYQHSFLKLYSWYLALAGYSLYCALRWAKCLKLKPLRSFKICTLLRALVKRFHACAKQLRNYFCCGT